MQTGRAPILIRFVTVKPLNASKPCRSSPQITVNYHHRIPSIVTTEHRQSSPQITVNRHHAAGKIPNIDK